MENASKALIMAGSVLLAMLIIGALVLMYNALGDLKSTEADSKEVQQLVEYNKRIEKFNKEGLYGSEILSLANLIADYNKVQADLNGYTPINLTVQISREIIDAQFMKDKKYTSYETLTNNYRQLQNEINDRAKYQYGNNKSISYFASLRQNELEDIKNNFKGDLKPYGKISIEDDIEKYNNLKSEQIEFKNKKYKQPQVSYDKNTGRIINMNFTEM